MRVISEFEFAEILLRTAHISERDVEVYVSRLRKRLGDSHVSLCGVFQHSPFSADQRGAIA